MRVELKEQYTDNSLEIYFRVKEISKTVEAKSYEALSLLYNIRDIFCDEMTDDETKKGISAGYGDLLKSIYDSLSDFSCDKRWTDEIREMYDKYTQLDYDFQIDSIAGSDVERIELIIDAAISERIRSFADKVTDAAWQREEAWIKQELYDKLIAGDTTGLGFENEIDFMRKYDTILVYPYDFFLRYREDEISVYYDESKKMYYVMHKGHRLYFPYENEDDVSYNYNQLLMEQDSESPHAYFSDGFDVKPGSVFLDVGGAEGMLSLEALDNASEIYIFECDESWKEALSYTFEGIEKVHIISKYAGRNTDGDTITLDDALGEIRGRDIYIKMDIEGMELDALKGAANILLNNNCRVSCTTYHTNEAYDELSMFFQNMGYNYKPSLNYMLFIYGLGVLWNGKYERIKEPYFRHGLIKAWIGE